MRLLVQPKAAGKTVPFVNDHFIDTRVIPVMTVFPYILF